MTFVSGMYVRDECMGQEDCEKARSQGLKKHSLHTDVSSSQMVECDMQLLIKSPILTSYFTFFHKILTSPTQKKVDVNIPGLKFPTLAQIKCDR